MPPYFYSYCRHHHFICVISYLWVFKRSFLCRFKKLPCSFSPVSEIFRISHRKKLCLTTVVISCIVRPTANGTHTMTGRKSLQEAAESCRTVQGSAGGSRRHWPWSILAEILLGFRSGRVSSPLPARHHSPGVGPMVRGGITRCQQEWYRGSEPFVS